jgi:hypothetical protein
MNERKRYRVYVDGGSYTCELNEAEIEQLHRLYHGFVRIEEVIQVKTDDLPYLVPENSPLEQLFAPAFDYDQLAQEIYEEAQA